MQKIKITDIPNNDFYTGYLWYSDKSTPLEIIDEKFSVPEMVNPFIIEGQLINKSKDKSYSIKFVDGEYIVYCFDLYSFKDIEVVDYKYLANRFKETKNIYFKQFWRPCKDEYCENMEVLKPAEFVFVGFDKKKE